MLTLGPEFPNPGTAQRQNPYLQIPLDEEYHTGLFGIDSGMGVSAWEDAFGSQLEHLESVNNDLGYDIWELAKQWAQNNRASGLIVP